MLQNLLKKHAEKIRFIIVGIVNTAIDFSLLFILVKKLGLPDVYGNIISTSVALIFSFFANKTFTFKDNNMSIQKAVKFLAITLFGLWVLQNMIIVGFKAVFGPLIVSPDATLLVGKLLATCASLVWNYLMYRKFVFNK